MGMSKEESERLRTRPEKGTPAWFRQQEQKPAEKPAVKQPSVWDEPDPLNDVPDGATHRAFNGLRA